MHKFLAKMQGFSYFDFRMKNLELTHKTWLSACRALQRFAVWHSALGMTAHAELGTLV